MSNLPGYKIDVAVTEAASLVMGSVNRAVSCSKASSKSITRALVPSFGISWGRSVIGGVGRCPINTLLAKLRNSPLPRAHYGNVGGLLKDSFVSSDPFLPEWVEWRHLPGAFLDRRFPPGYR